MKKKRINIYFIAAVLLCLTAAFAILHLVTREKVPEGSLQVQHNGKSSDVRLDEMKLVQIRGSVVNGKGEEQEIDQMGVRLADVLEAAGIESSHVEKLSVVADDEYSAQVLGEEVNAPDKVFLAQESDGSMKLIVFGDSDLKRNIRNVVRVIVG